MFSIQNFWKNTKHTVYKFFVGFAVMTQQRKNPPSPVDMAADEALYPTADMLEIVPINHYLDLDDFRTDFPVVVEILRGHTLYYALNETVEVPLIYVQQLWRTLQLDNQDPDNTFIIGRVDESDFRLNVDELRKILHLAEADHGGNVSYRQRVDSDTLRLYLLVLGYRDRQIGLLSSFNMNKWQPI